MHGLPSSDHPGLCCGLSLLLAVWMGNNLLYPFAVGSGGGSVSWLAGLSAFQGGSGVPRATDWDESQQGLQGVRGVMSAGKATPAFGRPAGDAAT